MRALITGGAGFIGSHLAHQLASDGAAVMIYDNLSSGDRENLNGVAHDFVEGDVADFDRLKQAAAGCDVIFHQAALVSIPLSIADPQLNQQSNVVGTASVFEAARQNEVKRVVYASSAAVYGNAPGLPKRESDTPDPQTPYAAAKLFSEITAAAYRHSYGLDSVGLRYMNVFGPRQDPSSPYSGVLSIFCRACQGDGCCTIYGDGEQSRDFVFVSDVVAANVQAAVVPSEKIKETAVFNIGRGEQTSLNQIVALLGEIRDAPLSVSYEPERQGDIRHSVADISAAKLILGFEPAVSVLDGLKQTLAWMTDY